MDAVNSDALVFFGATGDLAYKKIFPSLQAMVKHNRLNVPALVIVGGHEPQKTIELSYEWHQQIPGSEYTVLPDAFHGAAREEPVTWNATVHGF